MSDEETQEIVADAPVEDKAASNVPATPMTKAASMKKPQEDLLDGLVCFLLETDPTVADIIGDNGGVVAPKPNKRVCMLVPRFLLIL